MKRLIGFTVILVALLISGSAFAKGFPFELNGKKYEAAPQDVDGFYTFAGAKAACYGLVDPDDYNDDWFLPSKDELNAMYEHLHKKGDGGFAYNLYWSSTEKNAYYAWSQYFYYGFQAPNDKERETRVRCVRAL